MPRQLRLQLSEGCVRIRHHGFVLLLFLIGLEIKPSQLSSLGRDAISFGLPQIAVSAGVIGVYAWLGSRPSAFASY
jgi:Kef-type K+ transport system membrane component KefB